MAEAKLEPAKQIARDFEAEYFPSPPVDLSSSEHCSLYS